MKSFFKKLALAILIAGMALTENMAQQPFACDGRFYATSAASGGNTSLISITKDTSKLSEPVFTTIFANAGARLTAMGFNVVDNFIYALDFNTHQLVRTGADGSTVMPGVPPNLNTSLEYYAGEVRPQGHGLYVIGRKPDGNDEALYTISLQPPYHAGLVSIVTDEPVRIGDVAFDPVLGGMYGFDNIKKRIVRISTGGNVTSVHFEKLPQVNAIGSLFFDRWGNLYGQDGASLYLFNKFNGKILKTFQITGGSFSDGCACPYQVDFFKKTEPKAVIPCSEVTVTYLFKNTAAISYGHNYLEDEFPPGFTITEIVRVPLNSEVVSGTGTNKLRVEAMDILLGPDSVVIKVNAGNTPGTYASQAVAGDLPLGLGIGLASDDPATATIDDPTSVKVLDAGSVILQAAPKICPGATTIITAAANGSSYKWSNGSTGPWLPASEAGWYWVEIEGPCGIYRDSVLVEVAAPVTLDLGADQVVSYGEEFHLEYTTNAAEITDWQWASTGAALSCTGCPNPKVRLIEPSTFSLVVTDGYGCTATDELHIGIEETRLVYFPNAFSPNDDGINDLFYIQGKGDFVINVLKVYDRWGSLLFEKKDGQVNDPLHGWNGRAKGKDLDPGAYFWFAEIAFPNKVREQYSGTVLLIR